jgi:hypothetical protein
MNGYYPKEASVFSICIFIHIGWNITYLLYELDALLITGSCGLVITDLRGYCD